MPRVVGPQNEYFAQLLQNLQMQLYSMQTTGKSMGPTGTFIHTEEFTSSTTYTDLTTPGPIVECQVGVSGNVVVSVSSYVGLGGQAGPATQGFVGVEIDGSAPVRPLDAIIYLSVSSATAVGIASNQSSLVLVSGLTQGSHQFKMVYKTDGGITQGFANRYLQVTPIYASSVVNYPSDLRLPKPPASDWLYFCTPAVYNDKRIN